MNNLITDVPGLIVGQADDPQLASGVTAVIFDRPAVASIAIVGGAPGVRDCALLEPGMTVEAVDALVLSGGSAFGLDAMGGVQAHLRAIGRGFPVGDLRVPIVPGAILFDLANGGDKHWPKQPPYWELGWQAARNASDRFALGTAGAGFGATTANLKGGLGSASARSSSGFWIGAIVAVNAVGQATIGESPYFWAAPFEQASEFGGLGWPVSWPAEHLSLRLKGDHVGAPALENTTIAIVATDAVLTKDEAKRMAMQSQGALALALRPTHAAHDGDVVFAAATGHSRRRPADLRELTEIGLSATDCLSRAIARGVFLAAALPFSSAVTDWRSRFGDR
jgi:L-aminopeptidase/D-esterase-like protein